MGFFLTLVQVNRVGGSVLANALSSIHQLTPAEIGVVIGVMFLSSALVQIPFGIMLDRFGARRMIVGWSSVAKGTEKHRAIANMGHKFLSFITSSKPRIAALEFSFVFSILVPGGLSSTKNQIKTFTLF